MRTSVLMERELLDELNQVVAASEGYGARAGSRWICEAIVAMVSEDPNLVRVGLGEDVEGRPPFDALKTVKLDASAQEALELAINRVRRQDATQEGVRSAVIRAAVRRRMQLEGAPTQRTLRL